MKSKNTLSLLINPFERIAGSKALLWGLAIFIVSILLAYCGNLVYDGVIDAHFGADITLLRAFIVAAIPLLVFVLLLYIAGLLLSESSIRFIDVLGTVTFARAPYLLVSLVVLIPIVPDANMQVAQAMLTQNFGNISVLKWCMFLLFIGVTLISTIWFIILAYRGFSVSCNIKGSKAILGYIVALLVAEFAGAFAIYQITKYLL